MEITKTKNSLFYLYGLIPTAELGKKKLGSLVGIDNRHEIYLLKIANVTALICELDEEEFSEKIIEEKVKHDMAWLEEKAFHHHQILEKIHQHFTLIPLKFCTIYKNEENIIQSIKNENKRFEKLFETISNKEEWNVKVYCDDPKVKKEIVENSSTIKKEEESLQDLSPGKQFFAKKKLQQKMDEMIVTAKREYCEDIHQQIVVFCDDSEIKRNWNQEMSGRKQDMNWNAVYLVNKDDQELFMKRLKELHNRYIGFGFTIEWTGPWPCYHFANL
ncbi:GvpL/GvpF family gas vesicle protein [Sutcliffiella rhizosphaerae]|uniref:Uncharacterized protein n=1 Tax=Sutcliffiella rhizosphaerae TaxID=2880967 RepID=A0ABM8YMC0_9BACI|nr:GvpL/GvpF family gas vesicle protein [Sutcliffiella rhizosphaerae]CAG9621018.1 hypothetical protein BACCIP111883_01790 [Sutcliffiella rhizosphaerae]